MSMLPPFTYTFPTAPVHEVWKAGPDPIHTFHTCVCRQDTRGSKVSVAEALKTVACSPELRMSIARSSREARPSAGSAAVQQYKVGSGKVGR